MGDDGDDLDAKTRKRENGIKIGWIGWILVGREGGSLMLMSVLILRMG